MVKNEKHYKLIDKKYLNPTKEDKSLIYAIKITPHGDIYSSNDFLTLHKDLYDFLKKLDNWRLVFRNESLNALVSKTSKYLDKIKKNKKLNNIIKNEKESILLLKNVSYPQPYLIRQIKNKKEVFKIKKETEDIINKLKKIKFSCASPRIFTIKEFIKNELRK